MLKLKDINIFYVKFMFMMGWDELNVFKNGVFLYLFFICIFWLYIYMFKFYDNFDWEEKIILIYIFKLLI